MSQTIVEKILARHCGKKEVFPGEFIEPNVDVALGNDVTSPLAIKEFRKAGASEVFDKGKVVLVMDHFTPNKDIKSADQVKFIREFAKEQNLKNYFEGGNCGVEHALLPEKGIVLPGDLVIGADSHTCTYGALGAFATGVGSTDLAAAMITGRIWLKVPSTIKFVFNGKLNKWAGGKDLILFAIGMIGVDGALYQAMEFTGPVIEKLPMSDRFSMSNMAIEAGAKCGLIAPDKITVDYVRGRAKRKYNIYKSDPDAKYAKVIEIDCSKIDLQVSLPFLPSNAKSVHALDKIYINQVVIGSCTNGRIEDFRIAAKILKGKKVDLDVRLLIIPATPKVYDQILEEGLIKLFRNSGAIISPPTCGPCLGGHMGILAEGERCVATTNRNFVGRMGHPKSEVYLAGPAVAAASAIKGYIVSPDKI
ncbi:MAG: 3-isopropylmalate dehydratase large subunit [Elusimicrobia bacterium]|nr:3-isopropylmalate dehydratase large subunit [Candidatus Liberimonas magnetica]